MAGPAVHPESMDDSPGRLGLVTLALLCAGCGSSPPEEARLPACGALPVEGRYVIADTRECPGCTVSEEKLAADGDVSSYATVRFPEAGSGTVRIRAGNLGQPSRAGAMPNIVIDVAAGQVDYAKDLALRLALRGRAQAGSEAVQPAVEQAGVLRRVAFATPLEFDEMEFRMRHPATGGALVRVHEVCTS